MHPDLATGDFTYDLIRGYLKYVTLTEKQSWQWGKELHITQNNNTSLNLSVGLIKTL
jgi:hypothetical protein